MNDLGIAYFRNSKFDDAIKSYEQAIHIIDQKQNWNYESVNNLFFS